MPGVWGAPARAQRSEHARAVQCRRAPQGQAWVYNRSGGLYDFRARFWSPQLGAFLQLDQYQFLSSGGTLWSWPGQNPFRYGDPTGRDAEEWFLRNGNDIADGLMTGSSVLLTIATMGAAWEVGAALAEGRLLVGAALRLGAAGAAKGALLGGAIEAARQGLTTKCPTDFGKIGAAAFDGAVAGAVFGARGGIGPLAGPKASPAVDPELNAEIEAALAEANSATTTLYHGGVLRNGAVDAGGLSTTTSFEHAAQYAAMRGGQVYRFDVPNSFLRQTEMNGGLMRLTDSLQGTGTSAAEIRFLGNSSVRLGEFLSSH